MKPCRWLLAGTGLILLAGLNLVHGADRVLVRGDPPLTQEVVDLYQQMWDWYCDVKLTPQQRRLHTLHFINFWKKRTPPLRKVSLAAYRDMEKQWREIRDMKEPEQARKRAEMRSRWMEVLGKSSEPVNRFLVAIYDRAYKPGGRNNPILVAGDAPLTRTLVDLDAAVAEMVLDVRLTDAQRREHRRLLVEDWKKWDKGKRQLTTSNLESWAKLPTRGNYRRNELRALNQAKFLAAWAEGTSATARWLAALHKAAYKPGSARNPVLVKGEPPLTQLLVDRYADYLEIMVDLSVSGGFSAMERNIVQEYLVERWNEMGAVARKELIAGVRSWEEAAGTNGAEADKYIVAMRPKLLAQFRAARDDPLSLWLLEVRKREMDLHKRNLALMERRHKMALVTISAIPTGPKGHWVYDSKTRRYDRWVED
jgi:hypothetical protein